MTSEDLIEYVVGKAILDRDVFWGLFEVVCQGQLGKMQWPTWTLKNAYSFQSFPGGDTSSNLHDFPL